MILDKLQEMSSGRERTENGFRKKRSGAVGIHVVKTGHLLVVRPRVNVPSAIRPSLNTRASVEEFSRSSACRMRRYLRSTLADYSVMVTLTYPCGYGFDGRLCKQHLKQMLQRMQRYVSRETSNQLYGTFWFMEFQSSGAIHFHLFTTDFFSKNWIARAWYDIVGSDDERHLSAGTRIEKLRAGRQGACSYAAKYACKQSQKIVPENVRNSGRFWGAVGYRSTMEASTWVEPEDAQARCVQRAINSLERNLNDLMAKGQVTKTHHDGGTYVYYLRTLHSRFVIEWCVDAIESAINVYNPRTFNDFFDIGRPSCQ